MTRDTCISLFLTGELVAALRANDPDAFRGLMSEGMQELGVTEVKAAAGRDAKTTKSYRQYWEAG